jgi:DNA anti-recombination protein RmuC
LFAVDAVCDTGDYQAGHRQFQFGANSRRDTEVYGSFYKQWGMFLENLDQLGKRIDGAQKEFAKLTTTRKNQLEKPLEQIERLRVRKVCRLLIRING